MWSYQCLHNDCNSTPLPCPDHECLICGWSANSLSSWCTSKPTPLMDGWVGRPVGTWAQVWNAYGSEDVHFGRLDWDAVWACRWVPMFWRNMLLPSSGQSTTINNTSINTLKYGAVPKTKSWWPWLFFFTVICSLKQWLVSGHRNHWSPSKSLSNHHPCLKSLYLENHMHERHTFVHLWLETGSTLDRKKYQLKCVNTTMNHPQHPNKIPYKTNHFIDCSIKTVKVKCINS